MVSVSLQLKDAYRVHQLFKRRGAGSLMQIKRVAD